MENANDKNIGKKLDGRYEITELIGEGGMADVYRATDTVDHKTVAVKILKKEFAENEEFLRRFRNESKAIAVLSHPNIVKVYDVGFSERIQFIVMEYIDGITLNEYMVQEGTLNWKDAVHFILQILRALQHAHSKGIVHRDIKPQNIMMLKDGTIKVMDFGIAKFAREEAKDTSDKAIGTVHYISPEQARGGDTDAKSDIYSVGVMLYEMMTGKKPFDSDKPVSIAVMHMQAEIPLPHTVREDIPIGMEEIILKAMQKDPNDRYQTARDMMDDIATFKDNQSVIFGYFPNTLGTAPPAEEETRFYTPAPEEEEPEDVYDEEYGGEYEEIPEEEYDEDDDDEYEEEESRSFFVPILSAVIIVVIVIAAVLGTSIMWDLIQSRISGNKQEEFAMPNLVGMDYDAARIQYQDTIQFDVWSREYSVYEKNTIFEQSIPAMDPVMKGDKVKVKVSMGAQNVKLMDVSNWDYETAKQHIMTQGLQPDPRYEYNNDGIAAGKVIRTEPAGPCELEPGSYVTIYISRGENKQTVAVPNFHALSWDDARQLAENSNLTVSKKEVNDSAPLGYVLSQSIDADTQVTAGSTVELTVSNGIPPTVEVRVFVNLPADAVGTFHITMYEGGIPTFPGPSFNVAYANGSTPITVKGSGVRDFTAVLYNDATNASETIGKCTVDFDKNEVSSFSAEAVRSAFDAVGGLAAVTATVPGVTTTSSTNTTSSTSSTTKVSSSTTPATTTSHSTTSSHTTTSTTTTKVSTTTTTSTAAPPRVEPEVPENQENQQ